MGMREVQARGVLDRHIAGEEMKRRMVFMGFAYSLSKRSKDEIPGLDGNNRAFGPPAPQPVAFRSAERPMLSSRPTQTSIKKMSEPP